jgi:hypothetical protein
LTLPPNFSTLVKTALLKGYFGFEVCIASKVIMVVIAIVVFIVIIVI